MNALSALVWAALVHVQQPTLALVGGRVIDGYGGPPIENGVVLIAGERIVAVGWKKRRIARGEIPGPRLFVSGPFIQHAPYSPYEARFRWGVNGPEA